MRLTGACISLRQPRCWSGGLGSAHINQGSNPACLGYMLSVGLLVGLPLSTAAQPSDDPVTVSAHVAPNQVRELCYVSSLGTGRSVVVADL